MTTHKIVSRRSWETYSSRVADTSSRNDATKWLPRLLSPVCGALDGSRDAVSLEDIAVEEFCATIGQAGDKLCASLVVHIQDGDIAPVLGDCLDRGFAETRGTAVRWLVNVVKPER